MVRLELKLEYRSEMAPLLNMLVLMVRKELMVLLDHKKHLQLLMNKLHQDCYCYCRYYTKL